MHDHSMPARTTESVSRIIRHGLNNPSRLDELIASLIAVSNIQERRVQAARKSDADEVSTLTAELEDEIDALFDGWARDMSEIELAQLLRMSLFEAELGQADAWRSLLELAGANLSGEAH